VAFAIFMLVRIVNSWQKAESEAAPTTKECPRCLSAIPLKATRCAHCTSDLAPA
jgi:large conductance mechanosensitive channel